MAQNLFKTRYLPNADGSESSTALTNANCAFVHTYLGDDNTGDGTRQKPYRSATKANLKGLTYILFRGLINEYFALPYSRTIIGDDINQVLLQVNYSPTFTRSTNITTDVQTYDLNYSYYGNRIICTAKSFFSSSGSSTSYYVLNIGKQQPAFAFISTTIHYTDHGTYRFFVMTSANSNYQYIRYLNSICFGVFGLYAASIHQVRYCVLNQMVVYRLAGVNIVIPALTPDAKANVQLIRDAFTAAGLSSTYTDKTVLFPIDSFGNETCQVVREERDGGTHKNIFNKYDAILTGTLSAAITANSAKTSITLNVADPSKFPATGDVFIPNSGSYTANGITIANGFEVFTYTSIAVGSGTVTLTGASYTFKVAHSMSDTCKLYLDPTDFSLNPDHENVALFASDTGGFVGWSRPAYDSIQSNMTSVIVVDEATGADTATAGDLIQLNSAGEFVFNALSTQTWNRFRDNVTKYIPQGSAFKGGAGRSTDGSPFGYYIGKKQNLIGTTKYYAGDALTVGKWYKVFNDSAISVSNAIIYNSVQYLPEYTFCCVSGVTTFSLLNAGTGTYVMEVLADVMESIEILPVDFRSIITSNLSGLVTTIPVNSTSGFPTSGTLYIGNKTFVYTSIDATNFYGSSQDVGTVIAGYTADKVSTFPLFSTPINGECKLLYYTSAGASRYGKTAGNPVLFADLAVANMITDFGSISNKIAYYDSWAISNADQEFFVLGDPSLSSPKSTYFTTAIPVLRIYRRSINAHFDKPYDY